MSHAQEMSTLAGMNKGAELNLVAMVTSGRIRESTGLLDRVARVVRWSDLIVTADLLPPNANMGHFQGFKKARKWKWN